MVDTAGIAAAIVMAPSGRAEAAKNLFPNQGLAISIDLGNQI